jgi:hypothetical protein
MTHPVADWPADAEILSLFREWIVAQTEAAALSKQATRVDCTGQDEFDAACDRIVELVQAIARTASLGPVGLSIKAYLRHHSEYGSGYGRPETLGEINTDGPYPQIGADDLDLSMVEDAVHFVPELAPLAAAALAPAEKEAA